jgi:hypothetical protein
VRLKLDAALRLELERRGLEVLAYQPQHLFQGSRRLPLVPEEKDHWSVSIFRVGVVRWADGAFIGRADGETPSDAIRAILGRGDLRGSISRLTVEIDRLSAVLRA